MTLSGNGHLTEAQIAKWRAVIGANSSLATFQQLAREQQKFDVPSPNSPSLAQSHAARDALDADTEILAIIDLWDEEDTEASSSRLTPPQPAAEAREAVRPSEPPDVVEPTVAEPVSSQRGERAEAGATPARRTRQKLPLCIGGRSPFIAVLLRLLYVVVGGILGCALGVLLQWWLLHKDLFNLAPRVPARLQWMVPPDLRAQPPRGGRAGAVQRKVAASWWPHVPLRPPRNQSRVGRGLVHSFVGDSSSPRVELFWRQLVGSGDFVPDGPLRAGQPNLDGQPAIVRIREGHCDGGHGRKAVGQVLHDALSDLDARVRPWIVPLQNLDQYRSLPGYLRAKRTFHMGGQSGVLRDQHHRSSFARMRIDTNDAETMRIDVPNSDAGRFARALFAEQRPAPKTTQRQGPAAAAISGYRDVEKVKGGDHRVRRPFVAK